MSNATIHARSPRSGARAREPGRRRGIWPLALLALALAIGSLAGASCTQDGEFGAAPGGPGSSSGSICVGPTCPEACAAHPAPGCACSVEGQHLRCGKADATYPDGTTVCGEGVSVCTQGVWGECVINGAITLAPNAPPGFYVEGLGQPTNGGACSDNPCDPGCIDYPDTPGGVDVDGGLVATDAGVTIYSDGGVQCVKKTCADLGKNCGPVSDTCGGLLDCGTCPAGQACGAGGTPSVCAAGGACTNLCLQQTKCSGGATTSVSGTVYMPNGTTPLPNVVVYVPNAPLQAFTAGVSCDTQSACLSGTGSPLVQTTTAVDGTFTLTNMPVGADIPLVIQLGRFRRQVTIPSVPACVNTDLSKINGGSCKVNGKTCTKASDCCSNSCSKSNGGTAYCDPLTRFPKNKTEGDIPKMAFVTGKVDVLECVWRKAGIDDSEFTNPSGAGRINFYQGAYAPGTYIGTAGTKPKSSTGDTYERLSGTGTASSTPWEDALVGSPSTLADYDIVLFPCQGAEYFWDKQSTYEGNIADYLNAGGRVFTTHFNYIWTYSDADDVGGACTLNGKSCTKDSKCCSRNCNGSGKCVSTYSSSMSSMIQWAIDQSSPSPDPDVGLILTNFQKGKDLAQWMVDIGASTTYGQISINTLRHDFNGVNAPAKLWMTTQSQGVPMQATFGAPLGVSADNQCGRLVHSDFHVETVQNAHSSFPNECPGGGTSDQEYLLMETLFDLASCVVSTPTSSCTPLDCASQGLNCGPAGDGCGNTIQCGSCAAPATCGGAGVPGVCGTPLSYAPADFVRDYDATGVCPSGSFPVWRLYSWTGITPSDSHIDFYVQTATTQAGLATAPKDPLLFSSPPLGSGDPLVGTAASAHAADQPPGSPDTQVSSASPDTTLATDGRGQNNAFLRVTAHLQPSSDKQHAPTLSLWDMQIDCTDGQ